MSTGLNDQEIESVPEGETQQIQEVPLWKQPRPYKDLKFASAAQFRVRISQYTALRKYITDLLSHRHLLDKCLLSTRELCSQMKKYPDELTQKDYENLLKDMSVINARLCEAVSTYTNMMVLDRNDLKSGPYASHIHESETVSLSRESIFEEFKPEIKIFYREKQII